MKLYKFIGIFALVILVYLMTINAAAEGNVYNESIIDAVSGRTIHYMDLNGQNTIRNYFTQMIWCSDNKRFIVGGADNNILYEYNIETSLTKALNGGVSAGTTDVYVTPGNTLFFNNKIKNTVCKINMDTYEQTTAASYPAGATNPWGVQATNDSRYVSINCGGIKQGLLPVLDTKTGIWDTSLNHAFTGTYNITNHIMINPAHPDLIFFAHEGTTTDIFDRLWVMNRNTGIEKNVFKQYSNMENLVTGETSGHENWTSDGENIVFVKYTYPKNVGRSGIVRIKKDGTDREYINNDYKYWHCNPSSDGRWIVADTPITSVNGKLRTNIVLIDSKTSKSYLLANVQVGANHPWHPHPAFSQDGTKITFSMIARTKTVNSTITDVLGVGWMDITDLVQTGDEPDEKYGFTNSSDYILASPVILKKTENGQERILNSIEEGLISAETTVKNNGADNKNISLITAVYNNKTNRMEGISFSSRSIAGGTKAQLSCGVNLPNLNEYGYRCFLWNNLEGAKPFNLNATSPEKLRAVRTGANEIILSWQPTKNLSDEGYIVYRDDAEIGRVTDCVYRDSMLEENKQYHYEVRAFYNEGLVPDKKSVGINDNAIGYCVLSDPIFGSRLSFVDNSTNILADSYTEKAEIGGVPCRKATKQVSLEKTRLGMFYFKADDMVADVNARNIDVTVKYFDEGTNDIYLQYNSINSIAEQVLIVKRTNTGTWKTAKVSVTNAEFKSPRELTYSDFRIFGGENTYIAEVSVNKTQSLLCGVSNSVSPAAKLNIKTNSNPSITLTNNIQSVNMSFIDNSTNIQSDSYTEKAVIGGLECRKATKQVGTDRTRLGMFYFAVNSGMIDESQRNAAFEVTYFDEGTADIYIEYNSITSIAQKGFLIRRTGTNEWKTASLTVSDANFRKAKDLTNSDFRITGGENTYIYKVKVSKPGEPVQSLYQSVNAVLKDENILSGMTALSNADTDGYNTPAIKSDKACRFAEKGKSFYFNVDDIYMYGSKFNMADIKLTYFDEGTGEITLQYNCSDTTAISSANAKDRYYKSADTIIRTNTGAWKTVTFSLIDASFENGQDSPYYADFRINTTDDAGLYLSDVKVTGF